MASLSASNHVARVLSVADRVADIDDGSRIANSWRRCLIDHKLDPARRGPPQTFTEAEVRHVAEPMEELIGVAVPELEDLARVLRDAGYCVNLADPNATMLISRLPGGADDRMFLQWGVYTGSNFSEAFEGTNGLGTALAEQRPILVHRDEHFREQWGIFSCAVAPLFDHGGRLAGAVNITSCRDDLGRAAHQLALAVTMEATRRIERSIFRRRFRNAWIATVPGEGGSGLLAYDDDRRVVGACRSARSTLELTDGLLESGIELSDLVRFGSLFLNGGTSLTGERVVSLSWIADTFAGGLDSRSAFAASPGDNRMPGGMYRNQCWFPRSGNNVLLCLGIHGQMIYVNRAADMVAAKLSSWPLPQDATMLFPTIAAFDEIAANL